MADEPKLPPELINKLTQSHTPQMLLLKGSGPFQLPRLGTRVDGLALDTGAIEIRLETELGQAVWLALPELAAVGLRDLLVAEFLRRKAAKGG